MTELWPDIATEQGPPLLEQPRMHAAPRAAPHAPMLELRRHRGGASAVAVSWRELQRRPRLIAAVGFYVAVLVGFGWVFAGTWQSHAFFPMRPNSLRWSQAWLLAALANHLGAALCVCGVIVATERPWPAALWSLGCCLLGTPICAAYFITHLMRYGSAALRLR